MEKQPNHRCSWGSISAHPFWQPNPPAAPGTLPPQPLFDSIVTNLERVLSKQLEDQAIFEADKIFEQKEDFKDDSIGGPNLTFTARKQEIIASITNIEEYNYGNLSESKYHSNSAPNLAMPQMPTAVGTAYGQPNPTPMKVLPRSESTPIRPVAKPPPIPTATTNTNTTTNTAAVPLHPQHHPTNTTDHRAQEKGCGPTSAAKDTQHVHVIPDDVSTHTRTMGKQQQQHHHHHPYPESTLKDRMNLYPTQPAPTTTVAMNGALNSNVITPMKPIGYPAIGKIYLYIHTYM